MILWLYPLSCSHHSTRFFAKCQCLTSPQGSDGELKVEKDVASDTESKVDTGVPEVPVPADDTPEVLNKALSGLSSRYHHGQRECCLYSV